MSDDRAQIDAARAATGFSGPIPHAGEALRRVTRNGDFSGIRARMLAGVTLTPEELAALDALDRGDRLRAGPRDPATGAAETVVCWRWLHERGGWTAANARSVLAEMMGVTPDVIKARLNRAQGMAQNIAALTFDLHAQRDVTPALLRDRTPAGHCSTCSKVHCRCDPAPRPDFADTSEGATVAVLLSFWQLP
ncbi:hypothetical protein [Paracoccus shanxieyensis]|uniref:Uncharacterized protein n=1 Tax=Paracoccus shanxieyensis TaxID=2675752 RepID=A0A6L6J1S0_9RHOB|nr:hypothetical protein [Paracoccus shanxieyensis]MTH66746.1 hypothetical protein [Paracoccus shanxieyensis]MTH89981.1 hypothetical protein [Paracoccus shanxieyensis]